MSVEIIQDSTIIPTIYNKHYIIVDERNRVITGWSDGPYPHYDTSNAICINSRGGYQFKLFSGGEMNPSLMTPDEIPLYKWDGEKVVRRTEEDISADREMLPAPEPSSLERLRADVDYIAALKGVDLYD